MSESHSSTKACRTCNRKESEKVQFGIDRTAKDGKRIDCKDCRKEQGRKLWSSLSPEERKVRTERTRKWREANPEKWKKAWFRSNIKQNYGLSWEEYEQMFKVQNNLCAICGQPETVKGNGKDVSPLAVDHDHRTGKVRELLCRACNNGLGHFKDDPAIMEKAVAYLRKHQDKPAA